MPGRKGRSGRRPEKNVIDGGKRFGRKPETKPRNPITAPKSEAIPSWVVGDARAEWKRCAA